jgi:hypothetical protein
MLASQLYLTSSYSTIHTELPSKVDNICMNKLSSPKFGWIRNPTQLTHVEENAENNGFFKIQNKTLATRMMVD